MSVAAHLRGNRQPTDPSAAYSAEGTPGMPSARSAPLRPTGLCTKNFAYW